MAEHYEDRIREIVRSVLSDLHVVQQHQLDELIERIERVEASQQGQIDALTAQLTQVATDLGSVQTDLAASSAALQTEIDNLGAANPTLNLTALQSAAAPLDASVQALDGAVKTLGSLAPTPPAAPAA